MSGQAPSVNVIQEYFINVFRYKYIQYQGRARRKEYWMFFLFDLIFSLILMLPMVVDMEALANGLSALYTVVSIVPETCLGIRRLHDIGKSGWWLLLPLAGFIGVVGFLVSLEVGIGLMVLGFMVTVIIVLVFLCLDSQPGENQYGPNPKTASGEITETQI